MIYKTGKWFYGAIRRNIGRLLGIVCVIFAASLIHGCTKHEQQREFPKENITMICPWVQGGGTDTILRALCEAAEPELGVEIQVVNKAGDNGAAGFQALKEAAADGYTIEMITYELNSLAIEGLLDFSYRDIDPLMMVNSDSVALSAAADAPYDTVEELVAYARSHPGQLAVAQASSGSVGHVGAALFAKLAGIQMDFLSFEGTANAVTAVSNGYTELLSSSVAEARVELENGKLKLLGVMDEKRSDLYPDIPTFQEQGYDITYRTWRGLGLPKGVDSEKKEILEDAFKKALENKEFVEEMKKRGLNITYMGRDEFEIFIEENYEKLERDLNSLRLLQ